MHGDWKASFVLKNPIMNAGVMLLTGGRHHPRFRSTFDRNRRKTQKRYSDLGERPVSPVLIG